MAKEFLIIDFYTADPAVLLDVKVEQDINEHIEDYAVDIEQREAKAYERSLRIFLNC